MQHRTKSKQDSSSTPQPIHSYYQTTSNTNYTKWILVLLVTGAFFLMYYYYLLLSSSQETVTFSQEKSVQENKEQMKQVLEEPIKQQQQIAQRIEEKSSPVYQVKAPIYPLEKKNTYLLIGINTIPRKNNVDYLKQTIQSLTKQLNNSELKQKIHILVQNNANHHIIFEQLKEEYKDASDVLTFVSSGEAYRLMDPFSNIPNKDYLDPWNSRPGPLARQQNCDIVSLCSNALEHFSFEHFLFLEDDFLTCDNALNNLIQVLHLLDSFDPNYCSYRLSYGMSGLVMAREDLKQFITNYVSWNIDLYPIDLLIRQYAFDDPTISCKRGANRRRSYAYETVQWEHIGTVSTFEERNKQGFRNAFPRCDAPSATVWNLSNDERFHTQCRTGFHPKVAWNCI